MAGTPPAAVAAAHRAFAALCSEAHLEYVEFAVRGRGAMNVVLFDWKRLSPARRRQLHETEIEGASFEEDVLERRWIPFGMVPVGEPASRTPRGLLGAPVGGLLLFDRETGAVHLSDSGSALAYARSMERIAIEPVPRRLRGRRAASRSGRRGGR